MFMLKCICIHITCVPQIYVEYSCTMDKTDINSIHRRTRSNLFELLQVLFSWLCNNDRIYKVMPDSGDKLKRLVILYMCVCVHMYFFSYFNKDVRL